MSSNKDKYLYIQMEFCKGGNLRQWICEKNEGNMRSRDDALMIFQQIVQGVEYIHSQGHIHRDLKPENIFFGNDNVVKIGDLGLVTVINEEGANSVKRTKQKGTLPYMSPEQESLRNYDEKVDLYPLGLICFELLWEMRTGMERHKLWGDLRKRIFPPEFVKQYDSEHKLIKKMLSEVPRERPAASAIAQGLKVLMEEHNGLGDLKTV
ncbi:protein kinase containing Z-DNA binding domains [Megalops cyprinoides]|uniref:protein kinase containing Z-DNA binding domains n=1 Tax=Megalops cyprinoides TaxID=118141 RepID=UPI001863B729|nr:protein kinase containing Z-DNA binding domains [Megalops cyprinoides]